MKITSAKFAFSSGKISQIPDDGLREFAFIGRSNVGKSSLINMLCGVKGLAKVSGTPGKTRLINHFLMNGGHGGAAGGKEGAISKGGWYLVDLPGYGWARTSKSVREGFGKLITDYVTKSDKMWFLFVLVDVRLEPQKIDMEFMTMLGERGVPFGVVFTKADKLGTNALAANVANHKQALLKQWEELPPTFVTSSERRQGGEEILDFIGNNLI
ncbi:MAG: ribosome biogenesis GTP-binding protein YihA/YsxC [Alistipes sp.]|jgi:GTP-binding protein|nr:ribosome biogenesis GTP-binding protein YihA/YsxC [Alistipes sp.]